MRYFLSDRCFLKWLESPSVYNIDRDELYELDEPAFEFLKGCADTDGCTDKGCDSKFLEYTIGEGILTTERSGVRRPLIKKSPEPSLRYLELQITKRCNLRCRHCYIGPPEDVELTHERIKRVLDEFEEMQGLRLLITGGEPLLHREFPEINGLLGHYALRKILFTNGTLITGDVLRSLNVDEIQISLDGLEGGHDAIRGKGTFKKTMKGIEMALVAGFDVSISTMVHSMNLDDFDGMERLFRDIGIKEWSVDVPCVVGNLGDNPLFQLRPETAGRYLRYGFGGGLHGGDEGFGCGLHLASVTPEGGVAKCTFYGDFPAGNIDEGLEVCWKRIKPIRLDGLKCDCPVRDVCRGGCRYRAGLTGDDRGRDLYRCFAYDVM